jgi:glycosyltransferase involved in cell wall biosynthesis
VSQLILEPRLVDPDPAAPPVDAHPRPSVAVVITTYNHAHFLADAIDSVLAQTEPASDVIVVDDGSNDDPAAVVGRYPAARLIRQANQGLASARNTGLHAVASDKVIFLDADDRLLPRAIAAGLACFERAPDAGLVYGGHRRIDRSGHALGPDRYEPISTEPYRDLLRSNPIGMHATVVYDTRRLREAGGFDGTLPRCEDYDLYLRMSRVHPIRSHPETVAEYRWHGNNMSGNERDMLHWVLYVHARQQPNALPRSTTAEDWYAGRQVWREYYASQILKRVARTRLSLAGAARAIAEAMIASPNLAVNWMLAVVRRRIVRLLPQRWVYWIRRLRGRHPAPPVGSVRFGDFDRVKPISREFGYDRGTPIDRYYVELFLRRHANDVQGRALEVGDDSYCRRFGGSRITQQDVLHVSPGAAATITGDLSQPGLLPEAAFDCMVLTQTLHLIFDMRGAIAEIHRGLRPGGVLLLTVPGISQVDRGEWGDTWFWSLTRQSALRLFAEVFGAANVEVESHGNVFAATAFLQGLALEEVDQSMLDVADPAYPVVVTVRARRAMGS